MAHPVLALDYYDTFACTGSACPYHCCQNWGIDLSSADYNAIRAARKSKELQARVDEGMKRHKEGTQEKYAYFTTGGNVCAMLQEDGLCALQAECGYTTLPHTCKIFPRIRVRGKEFEVRACTAGCPEITKHLLTRTAPLGFVEDIEPQDRQSRLAYAMNPEKRPITEYYRDVLEVCVDMLQNRKAPLRSRMVLLGIALQALHTIEQEAAEADEAVREETLRKACTLWLEKYTALSLQAQAIDLPATQPVRAVMHNIRLAQTLRGVSYDPAFHEVLEAVHKALSIKIEHKKPEVTEEQATNTIDLTQNAECNIIVNLEQYQEARTALYAQTDVETAFENMMVNFLLTKAMPFGSKSIWEEYLLFCAVYSLLHFVAIGYSADHPGTDALTYALTVAYRRMVHSIRIQQATVEHMKQNDASTLAHMTILIGG